MPRILPPVIVASSVKMTIPPCSFYSLKKRMALVIVFRIRDSLLDILVGK